MFCECSKFCLLKIQIVVVAAVAQAISISGAISAVKGKVSYTVHKSALTLLTTTSDQYINSSNNFNTQNGEGT